ncbi:MAG: SIS domain-containing protein [Firmicutes bacterium]|nr:SIS domain-containing protein [Bacillota bacterium]
MKPTEAYYTAVNTIVRQIVEKEAENIRAAATVLAYAIMAGRLIHVFGTGGHSYMAGEEMFYRAGGLQPINAILDPGVSLAAGATRTTIIERTPGYARSVLDAYRVAKDEVMIIVNVNGINSLTIETALECQQRGLKVIAVTSREFSLGIPPGTPSRHPSNKNLFELGDIVIDLHVPPGDALLDLPGAKHKVAASSTVMVAFVLNCLQAETIDLLLERGFEPPIWFSGNMPGGDEANKAFIAANAPRIKHL